MAIGTPLKQDKGIKRSEIESSNMDIDEVHINKKFKFSHESEIKTKEDCMIVDPVPESITQVSTFNIEKDSFSCCIDR